MGKNKHPKMENPNSRGLQSSKPATATKTTASSTSSTTTKPAMTGNNQLPKATPQAQTGTIPKVKTATYPLTQKPQFLKPAIPSPQNQPQNHTGRPFAIPKGGDKRARDPSQNSKSSGRSIVPPPSKQQRSYAEAAKPFHTQQIIDVHWPEFQLRVYNASKHHEHISNNAFHDLKNTLARHTLDFLRTNPGQSRQILTTGIYYNKVLKCGIVNCVSKEALDWYRGAIELVSNNFFRGWGKEEQVTTCVKIFVPLGLDSITNLEYLEATRIMLDTDSTTGIPWTMLKDYIHHTKHTRIIIATIPAETFTNIQLNGTETNEGSRVWKTNGFLGPLKLTIASPNDLKSPNSTTSPKIKEKQTSEVADCPTIQNSPTSSPPPSPTLLTTQNPMGQAQGEETTREKPVELIHNNPMLSEAAGSMSPLHVAMDAITVSNEEEEEAVVTETTQEDMDYGLLASPVQSDTDDYSRSWAD
jgi:hypothetical protein